MWLPNCTIYTDGRVPIRHSGDLVKLARLLLVVAFMATSASLAFADGADPIVFTKGCTSTKPCDAVVLTSNNQTAAVNFTFSPSTFFPGYDEADQIVINATGSVITDFTLSFSTVGLSFTCDNGVITGTQFFSCSQPNGTGTTLLSFHGSFGPSGFCSADSNDWSFNSDGSGTFTDDSGDDDDKCSTLEIGLLALPSAGLDGKTISSTLTVPEPSSALLLFCGLMVGLVGMKFTRTNLA